MDRASDGIFQGVYCRDADVRKCHTRQCRAQRHAFARFHIFSIRNSSAQMAANKQFLFIGTDQSSQAVQVSKRTFSITQLGGFTPPINVFGIFGDEYGYVTLSFGSFRTNNNDFIVVSPSGSVVENGAVSQFMLNTLNAVLLNP